MAASLRLQPLPSLPESCSLPAADRELLASGRHPAITFVLGLQSISGHAVLRCWVSGAKAVAVTSDAFAEAKVPLSRAGATWLFEGAFKLEAGSVEAAQRSGWGHELHVEYEAGGEGSWRDPHGLGELLAEDSLRAFAEGRPREPLGAMLGAHHMEVRPGVWGTRFAVWAPGAKAMSVVGDFNFWDACAHPMRLRQPFGVWELCLPLWDLRGQKYGYAVLGAGEQATVKADPFALEFVDPTDGGHDAKVPECDDYSRIAWNGCFAWSDAAWITRRGEGAASWSSRPLAIYEVHLASWGLPGGYRSLAEPLAKHAEEMGFNAVEFLPVTQYPGEASWGYQCAAGLFAVDSRLGTPDDFRSLVDALHRRSIAVYVDFVGAHFAKDPWGLVQFAGVPQFEYEGALGELPQWGTARYDFSKPEVRAYLCGAVEHWIEQFHVDGLRLDAVAAMVYRNFGREADGDAIMAGQGVRNEEGISLLRELCTCVRNRHPGVLLMAEESTNFKWVTSRPVGEGTDRKQAQLEDLGFHLKWNMGFAYDGLEFMRVERARRPQLQSFGCKKLAWYLVYACNERWVLPFSHDSAQPRSLLEQMSAPGDGEGERLAQLMAFLAYVVGMPGRPLLFMGTEIGASAWSYDKPLDWAAVDPPRQQLKRWVAHLLRLYRELPALHVEDDLKSGFVWLDADASSRCTFAWRRRAAGAHDVVVLVNLSPASIGQYRAPNSSGRWRRVACSSMAVEEPVVEGELVTDLGAFTAQMWLAVPAAVDVRLSFEVCGGSHVRVVGGCPELGSWHTDSALALSCGADGVWRGDAQLPASHGRVEFKCISLAPGQAVAWEPIDGNRKVSLTGRESAKVAVRFGEL